MLTALLVGCGGFLGSISRYGTSKIFNYDTQTLTTLPWGTLIVNIVGCLLAGLLAGLAARYGFFSNNMRAFLLIGFLGGFTTFSAFASETVFLVENGKIGLAIINVALQVIIGIGVALAAYFAAKHVGA